MSHVEQATANVAPLRPLAVSIKQAAHILNLGRSTIYDRLYSGELEAVKDGARILVTMASIERHHANRPAAVLKAPPPRKSPGRARRPRTA